MRENPKKTDKYLEEIEDDGKNEEEYKKRKSTSKTYQQLAIEAIQKIGNKKGSSFVTICRYIEKNYDVSSSFQTHVQKGLKKSVEEGNVVLNKRSYSLAENYKPVSRSPSPSRKSKSPSPKPKRKTTASSRSPSPSKKTATTKKKKTADKPNKSPPPKKVRP